jgi:hypothetical protein
MPMSFMEKVPSVHYFTSSELHPTTLGSKATSSSHTILEGSLDEVLHYCKFCTDRTKNIFKTGTPHHGYVVQHTPTLGP